MKTVGLQPTDSGAEGGKETGERVGHMIVAGGPFEAAAKKLIARDFAISWKETAITPSFQPEGGGEAPPPEKSGKRVRYCCPDCDLKAWAKHDAKIVCGDHMVPMLPKN